jgi:hypothetical protein
MYRGYHGSERETGMVFIEVEADRLSSARASNKQTQGKGQVQRPLQPKQKCTTKQGEKAAQYLQACQPLDGIRTVWQEHEEVYGRGRAGGRPVGGCLHLDAIQLR